MQNNFVLYILVPAGQEEARFRIDATYDRLDKWAASLVVVLRYDEKERTWHMAISDGKLLLPLRIESTVR